MGTYDTPFPRDLQDLESGEVAINPRPELSILLAVQRYPHRWSRRTVEVAMKLPGALDLSPSEAFEVLERIEQLYAPSGRRLRVQTPRKENQAHHVLPIVEDDPPRKPEPVEESAPASSRKSDLG